MRSVKCSDCYILHYLAERAERPCFGMLTNGDEILFIKVDRSGLPQYTVSRVFATLGAAEESIDALRVLRQIGREAVRN